MAHHHLHKTHMARPPYPETATNQKGLVCPRPSASSLSKLIFGELSNLENHGHIMQCKPWKSQPLEKSVQEFLETAKIHSGNIATVCFVIFQMTLNTTKGQVTAHNLPYPKSRSFASLTDVIILCQKGKTITAHALILDLYQYTCFGVQLIISKEGFYH